MNIHQVYVLTFDWHRDLSRVEPNRGEYTAAIEAIRGQRVWSQRGEHMIVVTRPGIAVKQRGT